MDSAEQHLADCKAVHSTALVVAGKFAVKDMFEVADKFAEDKALAVDKLAAAKNKPSVVEGMELVV